MTRQRLRESSVKWNMTLSLDSFALKIVKKAEELAFSNNAKIIDINIPEKVKIFIEKYLIKEINHFRKKYKLEFNLFSDKKFIVPEYKIDLLNKNKKIIKTIGNFIKIEENFTKQDNKGKKLKFMNKKYNKNNMKKNKFKKKINYQSKVEKNNLDNKKLVSY
jgi:ribonuclease E